MKIPMTLLVLTALALVACTSSVTSGGEEHPLVNALFVHAAYDANVARADANYRGKTFRVHLVYPAYAQHYDEGQYWGGDYSYTLDTRPLREWHPGQKLNFYNLVPPDRWTPPMVKQQEIDQALLDDAGLISDNQVWLSGLGGNYITFEFLPSSEIEIPYEPLTAECQVGGRVIVGTYITTRFEQCKLVEDQ